MKKASLIYKLVLCILILPILYIDIFPAGQLRIEPLVYFTTQSNILVAFSLILLIIFPKQSRAKCIFRGISLIAIIITGIIYNFVLYKIHLDWRTAGYTFFTIVTHIIMPAGYILDWLLFDEHGYMKWKDIIIWFVYPMIYCVLSIFATITSGFLIYSFFDLTNGYEFLLHLVIKIICIVIIISLLIVWIDKTIMTRMKKNIVDI